MFGSLTPRAGVRWARVCQHDLMAIIPEGRRSRACITDDRPASRPGYSEPIAHATGATVCGPQRLCGPLEVEEPGVADRLGDLKRKRGLAHLPRAKEHDDRRLLQACANR
jgi:hypothetical protein